MMNKPLLTLLLPCYNEDENIPVVLPEIEAFARAHNFKVIIVNDGSIDNSRSELARFAASDLITIAHHKLNKGYGAALKTGLQLCTTEYTITLDIDGQHRLVDVLNLFEQIKILDSDMIIGSRKGQKSASSWRGLGKFLIRLIAKILMQVPVHDINSGMKIFRTDIAQRYLPLYPDGMSFSDIMTLTFVFKKNLVHEVPIKIEQRRAGKSTINLRTAIETANGIINIIVLFNPMRIFLPTALFFGLAGLIWGIPILLIGNGVSVGAGLLITVAVLTLLLGLIAHQLSAMRTNV
ncbi:glycosyltransferase family 2 protein [candidate division KSB1 bacterium]|nr:glycosyltransferase family 2 protein [candidate division KSB1 bacterium]RQW09419.1 MAG: glycosyltransferase family 2 protein [candidate division KSB1 bacterium]